MVSAIVGFNGFVGSNLCENYNFDYKFNSKNIESAYGLHPDILVYAGIIAEMFLANQNPIEDLNHIRQAIFNIEKIKPKKLVLISTVSVYDVTINVDENHIINEENLLPYGKNRLYLETWVMHNIKDYHIIRLPALYGKNLKKNYIYDFIHQIPTYLTKEKINQIILINKNILNFYKLEEKDFYKLRSLNELEKKKLNIVLEEVNFNSLSFTDTRNKYQFYNLKNLWNHILLSIENDIPLLNLVTEPISIYELYYFLTNKEMNNIIQKPIIKYNIKSKYVSAISHNTEYLLSKDEVVKDIKLFISTYRE